MSAPIGTVDLGIILSMPYAGTVVALILTILLVCKVTTRPRSAGDGSKQAKQMEFLADTIQVGAKSFLKSEYKYLSVFVVFFFVILVLLFTFTPGNDVSDGFRYGGCFLVGAVLSALSGWLGMIIATDSNVRTTYAAMTGGINSALQVAFAGGAVMGFTVVGFGLGGVTTMYALMTINRSLEDAVIYLSGFGFGASAIALFARVAGGIYTKAADVGADLVGKVEEDLPEDDPRNPAVIADNVGDNVGDVAGMGADLFESYVGSIIASATLADKSVPAQIALPFWIAGVGILCAAIGSQTIRTKDGATQKQLLGSLAIGVWVSSILVLGACAAIIYGFGIDWEVYGCIVIGLVCGILVGESTEYATSYAYAPVLSISRAGTTGPATVIIQGLGVGMLSCFPPVLIVVITIIACDTLAGGYGIAIAAVGMLSTLGVTLATDAYGPVADNAGGIAEMADLPSSVRDITDALDALGNTTAATGKGFAIGSAVLTALSLLSSFKEACGLQASDLDSSDPIVLGGILIGAVLPFVFAALTMLSVRKAATAIILEVRRQFRLNPGLKDPNTEDLPDYEACINISTKSSVEEMIMPGGIAILAPLTVGFLVGAKALAGLLTGAIASGFMMAVMMSNAGGAWDNAKKYIEIECAEEKKAGTEKYKACVVGDTVGDPFKDTSGPALNILIKLMSMVSLVVAPLFAGNTENWALAPYGVIPLVLMIIVIIVCYCLFWKNFDDNVAKQHAQYDAVNTGEEGTELKPVNTAEKEISADGKDEVQEPAVKETSV